MRFTSEGPAEAQRSSLFVMSDPKPLALIAVSDGRAGEFFWISMDGSEETCNPNSFVLTLKISESCVVIEDPNILNSFPGPNELADLVTQHIGKAHVCLVDSSELYAFTKDEALYRSILHKAIDCLPNIPDIDAPSSRRIGSGR